MCVCVVYMHNLHDRWSWITLTRLIVLLPSIKLFSITFIMYIIIEPNSEYMYGEPSRWSPPSGATWCCHMYCGVDTHLKNFIWVTESASYGLLNHFANHRTNGIMKLSRMGLGLNVYITDTQCARRVIVTDFIQQQLNKYFISIEISARNSSVPGPELIDSLYNDT